MRKASLFITLAGFLSFNASAQSSVALAQTREVDSFVTSMVKKNQSAFYTACIIVTQGTRTVARIVYFPNENKGVFIYSDNKNVVVNWGNTFLRHGRWELSNLEGGMSTIENLSNIYNQLIKMKFVWVPTKKVSAVFKKTPEKECAYPMPD